MPGYTASKPANHSVGCPSEFYGAAAGEAPLCPGPCHPLLHAVPIYAHSYGWRGFYAHAFDCAGELFDDVHDECKLVGFELRFFTPFDTQSDTLQLSGMHG